MRRASFADMNCSIAQSLEVVGEWWTPLIIRDALMGVTRFEDFQGRLGIARNVLSHRLNTLVQHGIFELVPYRQRPPRSEYQLTEKGRELWKALMTLRQWGDKWMAADGPPLEVVHETCGKATEGVLCCRSCGQELRAGAMTFIHGPGAPDGGILPEGA